MKATRALTAGFLVLALAAVASAEDLGLGDDPLSDPLGTGNQNTPTQESPVEPVEAPAPGAEGFDALFDDLGFGGGLALGVGLTLAAGALAASLFMGGTRFVTSENVLDNDARRTIFEYIRDNPGIHLRAAAQALDLSTTNVLWHLRKLEQANLVNSRKFEGYKVFYPSEGGVESRRRAIAASVLRNPHAKAILEYVVGSPSAHQREIARALGVNHGTVRWHLRKLNEAGLLLQLKKETQSMYYVSELGMQALSGWQKPIEAMPEQPAEAAPAP